MSARGERVPYGRTESSYEMVSYENALETVRKHSKLACSKGKQCEILSLDYLCESPLTYFLHQDVSSTVNIPSTKTSIMDGYAVVASDGTGVYPLVGESTAGHPFTSEMLPGQLVYVTTGSVVPLGADAVIKIEWTELMSSSDSDPRHWIRIKQSVAKNQWIRDVGSDVKEGTVVLRAGTELNASELGVLASIGCGMVSVFRKPVVGVFSTGDELVEFCDEPAEGNVRDSNRPMLKKAILESGGIFRDLGVIKDSVEEVHQSIMHILDEVDILVTSGGVSMGYADYIKPLLESIGTVHFGRIRMKPGKPTTFATIEKDTKTVLFFGLPGNPVSCMVTFKLFVSEAIQQFVSIPSYSSLMVSVQTQTDISLDPERMEFHRAIGYFDQDSRLYKAVSTGNQISSRLLSLRSANMLMMIPRGTGTISAGSTVTALVVGRVTNESIQVQEQDKVHSIGCGHHHHQKFKTTPEITSCPIKIGLLVCSDRAFSGTREDQCIGAFCSKLESIEQKKNFIIHRSQIVRDVVEDIENTLKEWCDEADSPNVIFTMGGTGFSPRDVTPEATRNIIEREAPSISQTILIESLKTVPMALLSRGISGIRKQTIVVNLVGSPKGVQESIVFIWHAIPHAVRLLTDTSVLH